MFPSHILVAFIVSSFFSKKKKILQSEFRFLMCIKFQDDTCVKSLGFELSFLIFYFILQYSI